MRWAALLLLLLLAACGGGALAPLQPQSRPLQVSDEAGFWQTAGRTEAGLQRSPLLIRDQELNRYVRGVACRVAGPYCGDIRVYLVREAGLNASMMANGAMLVQSGLLLRMGDEAQLAAVIAHEIGHYVERHTFEKAEQARRLGDLRAWTVLFALTLGAPGLGEAAEVAEILERFAFSREQERAADLFGLRLMAKAGYPPMAAAEVWQLAHDVRGDRRTSLTSRLLATHPAPDERRDRLRQAAAAMPGAMAERHRGPYRAALAPFRSQFFADEVRLRLPTETLNLFRQLEQRDGLDAVLAFHWGEVYRLRGWQDDREMALKTYARALRLPDPPAETHRGIGLVRLAKGQTRGARFAFERYLRAAPAADDEAIVRSYIAQML